MDMYSLVALNLRPRQPVRMDARAEDRYYASYFELPRLRLAGSIAALACAVLVLAGMVPS